MAEGSSSGASGPNGVTADLKERKLAITGPNVALILLILIIGVVGYLRTETINTGLKTGQSQVSETEARLTKRIDTAEAQLHLRIESLFTRLNTLDAAMDAQRDVMGVKVDHLKEYIEQWFSEMARREDVHNFNTLNPDKAQSLRGPGHEPGQGWPGGQR